MPSAKMHLSFNEAWHLGYMNGDKPEDFCHSGKQVWQRPLSSVLRWQCRETFQYPFWTLRDIPETVCQMLNPSHFGLCLWNTFWTPCDIRETVDWTLHPLLFGLCLWSTFWTPWNIRENFDRTLRPLLFGPLCRTLRGSWEVPWVFLPHPTSVKWAYCNAAGQGPGFWSLSSWGSATLHSRASRHPTLHTEISCLCDRNKFHFEASQTVRSAVWSVIRISKADSNFSQETYGPKLDTFRDWAPLAVRLVRTVDPGPMVGYKIKMSSEWAKIRQMSNQAFRITPWPLAPK